MICRSVAIGLLLAASVPAFADGRLLATGGVTDIDGSAGGGLVPWAVIAGYGTRDQIGATTFATAIDLNAFRLRSAGVAIGIDDRVELSYAHQRFDLGSTVPGASVRQDIVGIKLKLSGDAVFDADSALPQLAAGAQYRHNLNFSPVPQSLGASSAAEVDFYLAATKFYLAGVAGHNLLLDLTINTSRANQFGLLGYGGDLNRSVRLLPAASAAVFITDDLATGLELRAKPNNLSAFREQGAADLFLAYLPNKHIAITAAYTDLGQIADKHDQRGAYLSIQLSQ